MVARTPGPSKRASKNRGHAKFLTFQAFKRWCHLLVCESVSDRFSLFSFRCSTEQGMAEGWSGFSAFVSAWIYMAVLVVMKAAIMPINIRIYGDCLFNILSNRQCLNFILLSFMRHIALGCVVTYLFITWKYSSMVSEAKHFTAAPSIN